MRIPPGNTHVPCPLPIPSHSSRCAIDREAPCAPFPAQTPETQNQERATEPTPTKHLTQEDLEGIDSAVDFLEDIDGEALESIMEPRDISRCSFTSDGSSVLTERGDSRASVCTPPPTFPCCRFTSSLAPATFAVPDVPCPIRTRAGEASERRLRCMLSEREKYTLDPCAWKLAPIGTIQLIAHRSGMVKFINDLRRDFGLNSRVTWRAVTFMDRYVCLVSSSETSGCKLERAELCAIVCLLLACKFQEMHFPSIPQLLESISTLYTKQELKAAEVRTPAPPSTTPTPHPHPPTEPYHAPRLILAPLLTLACAPTQLEVLSVLGWSLNSPSPHAALEEMTNVLSEHHGEDLMPVVKHARILIELALWDPQGATFSTNTAPPPPGSPACHLTCVLHCWQLLPFTLWWWPPPLSSWRGPCSCTARTHCQRRSVRVCCVTFATSQQMTSQCARAS